MPKKIFIIAEVAQAHEGNFNLARLYIQEISQTGVDAVKFQTHIAAAESTLHEPFRISPKSTKYKNRYDYWKKMEFTETQWRSLYRYAKSKGMLFLSSPFSIEAVDLLERVGVSIWKIPSGEVTTVPLLERIIKTKKPVIVSTGMSSYKEIDELVSLFNEKNVQYTLLQTTTLYPCPLHKIGLNVMLELKKRYHCPIGLSDHSGTIYPSIAAAVLGASVLEVHVTLNRSKPGFDSEASLTIQELTQLVEGIRAMEEILTHPVNKNRIGGELRHLKRIFSKSIVAKKDLPVGTVINKSAIAFKKPGTGIPSKDVQKVVGKRLRTSILKDQLIKMGDLLRT